MRAHTITNLTRPAWRRLVLIVLGVCALALPATAGAAQQSTSAEAVRDWNLYAANALGNPPTAPVMPGIGQAPQVSVLHVGMVQGAVYDAVNAIDGGHQPYLAGLPPASPSASKAAAAATAAYEVLVGLQQAGAPMLPPAVRVWLDQAYADSLAAIPEDAHKQDGIAAGSAAAAAMLAARAGDGRFDPFAVVEGTDPGEWRKTPPNFGGDPGAFVGNVDPFLVPSVEMLRTDGPNALTSAAYAEDFNEVKELGSLASTSRTADQTAAAIFWQDSGISIWNRVFRALAESEQLDGVESARLLAMTNLAGADGSIGCWNDKYYWNFWRPITAIREAASDGNPATEADPAWLPLFNPTIPVSGAAARHPRLPGPPVGAHLHQRCLRARPAGLLRHRQDRLHRDQQQVQSRTLPAEELRPLLGGPQGDHRRARVERHPLPHRRRAGSRAGQEGRPLPGEALLPGPGSNRAARRPGSNRAARRGAQEVQEEALEEGAQEVPEEGKEASGLRLRF